VAVVDQLRSRVSAALSALAGRAAPRAVAAPMAPGAPPTQSAQAALAISSMDPNKVLWNEPGRISTDRAYRAHEFITWQGWYEWSAGWNPRRVAEAVMMHIRGWPYMSSSLARHVMKYPPIFGAMKQRMAPSLRSTWTIKGSSRAPGRYAVEDLRRVWRDQFRYGYGDTLRTLCTMGGQWYHVTWDYDTGRGVEMPRIKRWPWEATMWRGASPSFPGGWYAMTVDSGFVRMTPGDGKWIYLSHSERAHEMGAVIALGTTFVSGELARRDEAGLSEAAGRAAPYVELKAGVAVDDPIGLAVQAFVEEFGLTRIGGMLPEGNKLLPFQIVSDTDFFKNFTAEQMLFTGLVILGQVNTLGQGPAGVYQNLGGLTVAESLVDEDLEATIRGWQQLVRAYCEINGQAFEDAEGNEIITLTSERYADRSAKAKAEAERAGLLATTVAAQVAVFDVTQDDVDDAAARMSTPTMKLKTPEGATDGGDGVPGLAPSLTELHGALSALNELHGRGGDGPEAYDDADGENADHRAAGGGREEAGPAQARPFGPAVA